MKDAIASSEVFVEEPGRERRGLVIAIGRPQRDEEAGDWVCRVKLTAGRVDARLRGTDSLEALGRALGFGRDALERLRTSGWRVYATLEASEELDLARWPARGREDP